VNNFLRVVAAVRLDAIGRAAAKLPS
jgi:hypothetical protein